MIKVLLIALFGIVFTLSEAQDLLQIKSVEIAQPTGVSVDKGGYVFYAAFNGDIVRYNPDLEEKIEFSPSNPNTTTILEARQGLRIFTFHRDLQIFRLINRSLSLNEDYNFPPDLIGYVEIATSSADNNIWLIDQTGFSLKKYEIISHSLASVTSLDLLINFVSSEILYFKEYQNRLFISTKNEGILIFDNFGNYLKTYKKENVRFFNFFEDMIYYLEGDTLVKHNLYTDEHSITKLPKDAKWLYPLITQDYIYLFSKNKLVMYKSQQE
jgi:hypothetical protein